MGPGGRPRPVRPRPLGDRRLGHLETGESTVDGRHYDGVSGHSSYLQDQSTSQYNMATVVSGHPQDAVEGNNTGITDDPGAWDWWPSWLGG